MPQTRVPGGGGGPKGGETVCRNFAAGRCRFGSRCNWKHGPAGGGAGGGGGGAGGAGGEQQAGGGAQGTVALPPAAVQQPNGGEADEGDGK